MGIYLATCVARDSIFLSSVGAIVAAGSTMAIIMTYLRYGTIAPDERRVRDYHWRAPRLRRLANRDSLITTGQHLVQSQDSALASLSTESISAEAPSDDAKKSEVRVAREIMASVSRSSDRLREELDALSWRGNLNLTIGCVMAVMGIAILGYAVVAPAPGADATLSYYLPRAGLSLLIQLFAYFFLRLYRSSLTEIKYFQNEITTLDCKSIAVSASVLSGSSAATAAGIKALSATDRNFVLKKNETTVELERARAESSQLEVLKGLLETALKHAKRS